MNTRVVALLACVLVGAGAPAVAQESTPTPSPTGTPHSGGLPAGIPSSIPAGAMNVLQGIIQKMAGDATAGFGVDPSHVRGQVTFFRRFDLQVKMPMNTYKDVHLHQGTIINPRGATIEAGDNVDVHGTVNSDGSINANDITILR